MKVKMTPVAAAVSITLFGVAFAAQAQQAEPAKAEGTQLEQVVVTGIRASLQSAANIKKSANAVVDAISAEDVGKLPDSDVGQSLGRVPGVSVGRAFGQGAAVSIRGSDPQMTYTTLNGHSVASTGWYDQMDIDRSFNYSLLPSELIAGMEIYKSSQADLTEGGIGGTVIVKTRKPLDLAAGTAFISAKYGKGTISDVNKEVSGLYSWKDASKRFGALIAAAHSDGDYIRRGVEADSRWSADVAPTAFVQERARDAINVALQAKPSNNLELGLNLMSLKLKGDNSNTSHYIFHKDSCDNLDTSIQSPLGHNPDGMCRHSTTTLANTTPAFFQAISRASKMTSDTATFDGHYRIDGAKFDLVAGLTKADGGTSGTTFYSYGGGNLPKWTGVVDATGKQIQVSPTSDQTVTLANLPATSTPATWPALANPNKDKEKFGQLDGTFDLDWNGITAFKTGVRLADHTFEKHTLRPVFKSTLTPVDTSKIFAGTVNVGGWSVPRPNIGAALANTLANVDKVLEDRSAFSELNEKNTSVYGMFEFEAKNVRGNFGLRYVSTKVKNTGYAFDGSPLAEGDLDVNVNWSRNTSTQSASYNEVLPSANIVFDLRRDLVLRASVSQAMTRPNFASMFGVQVSGYNDDRAGNETWTIGNVGLKPMKSSQFDLSLEYYYGNGNLLSATLFTKDIANFIVADSKSHQKVGLVDPMTKVDDWTVQSFKNAGGATIRGLELQVNHAFGNGFGTIANYTYTEGNAPAEAFLDRIGVFTQASKHNVNLVGYYEQAQYSARLAYNWRSKYMLREGAFWYGNRMHDQFGTLDASLAWNINKNLKLTFEAANLLKRDDVQYGAAAGDTPTDIKDPLRGGFPAWSFKGETTYRLGLSANF